ATDPWTAAQVAARKDRSIADLLTEWDDKGAEVESMVDLFPGRVSRQLVLDLTEHEHDIRGALGKPGARDAPAVATGVDFLVTVVLGPSLIARGLGPLEVRAQGQTLVAGTGQPALTADPAGIAAAFQEISGTLLTGTSDPPPPQRDPVASVAAPAFELLRALTGRRSASQIAAFDWSAPPDPFIPAFAAGPFTMPDHDIVE
ncbi:MAG: hypothetical protein QOG64_256, partial [Acidimicrobiaceae bacterium]|nr:hypothetical protein [Acidimicrobiaceae bacterium]